jgi:glycosyltransferase involved in cell wall biosynthesis
MKVLHINQSDISGGAGIAGYRLHQGLLNRGIDSRLLVGNAQTKSDRVATVERQYRLENQFFRFSRYLGLNYLNLISSFNIPKHKFYQEAEILNFHNLHTGYFNYLTIPDLTENKPAIFTLHDMWSFTGHCAYSYDCDRWKSGCGKCAYLDTYPNVQKDNTRLEWKLKNWIYSRSNLTVVTPSKWLTEQVEQSILNRFPIHYIPYGIDTQAYQPLNRDVCRQILDIPAESKVLMFGAQDLTDSRKGGDLLLKTLEILPQSLKAEIVVLTMGKCNTKVLETLRLKTLSLGYLSSDRLKSVAYSATDLFVFPTRADNLPLVLQESMACATPMVSFKVGGVPDLVRHGITGYLASPEDTQDMSEGIIELLEDEDLRQQMSQNCRAIALEEYSLELQTQRYIELYEKALQN